MTRTLFLVESGWQAVRPFAPWRRQNGSARGGVRVARGGNLAAIRYRPFERVWEINRFGR